MQATSYALPPGQRLFLLMGNSSKIEEAVECLSMEVRSVRRLISCGCQPLKLVRCASLCTMCVPIRVDMNVMSMYVYACICTSDTYIVYIYIYIF